MNTPRSGFRRAAIASWALAGLGAAGVAGASALAYGDTVKPAAQAEDVAVVEQPAALGPALPPAPSEPDLTAPPVAAAPQPSTPAYTQASTPTYTAPATQYTQAPAQTYTPAPAQTYAPAAAPQGPIGGSSSSSSSSARSSSAKSSSSSSAKRVPMGSSGGPNKAVPHTVARGS